MTLRDARRGAAIAGAVLIALPAIEAIFGSRGVGAEHFATAIIGLWLVGVSATARFQFGFANEAREVVPDRGDFVLASSHRGLHVLARNEESLVPPVQALREVYGEKLEVEPARVRLIEGVQVHEPIMHVRISTELSFLEPVRQALAARGANPSEEYVRSRFCVLRYEAPLADLLGLPVELERLTLGTAQHWIVLSHYALVTRDPGGGRAA